MNYYSVGGLRDDMKFALRMAGVLSVIAAIPLSLLGLIIGYEHLASKPSPAPWIAYGELVAVVGTCYLTAATHSALVLFCARPVRRGRLGWGIGGFVVFTIALAVMGGLFLLFPNATMFLGRGPRSVMSAQDILWMTRFSPAIGVLAGIITAFQYGGKPKPGTNGEAPAEAAEPGVSTRTVSTPETRSRARLGLFKGAIFVALGGYFAIVGLQDLLRQTRSTGLQPRVLVVVSVAMLVFGLWRVKANLSDLKAP